MLLTHGATRWNDMAEEARSLAAEMRDRQSRRIMMGPAAGNEALAQYAHSIASAREWWRLQTGVLDGCRAIG